MIAKFSYRMENALFGNLMSPVGLAKDIERQVLITLLEKDLDELEMQLKQQQLSSKSRYHTHANPSQGTGLTRGSLQLSVKYAWTTHA